MPREHSSLRSQSRRINVWPRGAMMRRVLIGILAIFPAMALAQNENDIAGVAAHLLKEAYWNCLAEESVRVLPRKMSGPDFVIYIKGRCPDQLVKFRVAMIDYLAMRHPDVAMATILRPQT